ncbi:MAG TPA: type I polyketide synthase, partial [Pyrinomonadaceae bacterium]
FRGVQQVWQRDGEAIARIALDGAVSEDTAPAGGVHPLLLDNCLQVIACALPLQAGQAEGVTYLPVGVGRVRVGRRHIPAGVAWSYATLQTPLEDLPPVLTADAMLLTEAGEVVLELRGVRLQRVRSSVRPEAARGARAADESRRAAGEDTGAWLYEIEWRREELPSTQTPASTQVEAQGKWLIFADDSGVGEAVRSRLEVEEADACVLVRVGSSYRRVAPNEFEVDPASARDFDQLLAEASDFGLPGWRGVLHLWGLEEATAQAQLTANDLAQAQTVGCRSILHLLQSLDRAGLARSVRLWLATTGAQGPAGARLPSGIAHAPVWGLGRVIAREFHSLRCTMIDVNNAAPEAKAAALFQELRSFSGENQVAWSETARYVARLQRWKGNSVAPETDGTRKGVQPSPESPFSLDAEGTYLITGGLGGLGLKLAGWMVARGARHLALVGRSGATAPAREVVAQLEAAGAQVRVIAADVAAREQVEQALAEIAATMPPLKGVVHAAGVLEDALLGQQDQERFARVLAPKLQGAWNLHSLTVGAKLDFFVLFSSISSVLGSMGQSGYAAGNSFMDALAHHRRALGLHGLSINWGPWAEVGMAASHAKDFARQGIDSIRPEAGFRVLERLLVEGATQVGVLPVRWTEFIASLPSPQREPFLSDLFDTASASPEQSVERPARSGSTQATPPLVVQLTEALPSERLAILTARIQAEACGVLGLPSSAQLDVAQGFFDLGMDSLMIAELARNLEAAVGRPFPLSMMFEHANVDALAHYLSEHVLDLKLNNETPRPAAVKEETAEAELEQLEHLEHLEQLSDEEALALLTNKLSLE